MRRFPVSALLCLSVIIIQAQVNVNAPWTWVNGENRIPMRPSFGVANISSSINTPGGRKEAVKWEDQNGKLWLFGGYGWGANAMGYLGDLWKYDPVTNQWTWINGFNINEQGSHGTLNLPSATNMPGARRGSTAWVGDDGNFYLFGGEGFTEGNSGRLNDLWKYNPLTNIWTWIGGSATVDNAGVYGTMEVAAASNWPGGRNGGAAWKDNNGKLWLFGGDGFGTSASLGRLNDMWKYDPVTGQWTWMRGSTDINAANGSDPGGRNAGNATWKDNAGNLYLYGGITGTNVLGPSSTNPSVGYYGDLWRYNMISNTWSMRTSHADVGTYGTKGIFAAANRPGRKMHPLTWVDNNGRLWLYGGYGSNLNRLCSLNELWQYNPTTNQWAWMSGENSEEHLREGVYGTQGVTIAANKRDSRNSAITWKDNMDKLWSFGGEIYDGWSKSFHNDVWSYDPTTALSTWYKGDSSYITRPVYGTQGVAGATVRPAERLGSGSWADNNGNLWLFGGSKTNEVDGPNANYQNELWKYNITSGQWAWMKGGPGALNDIYGTKGVAANANTPGRREYVTSWTDASNNLWLFGGISSLGWKNDLWRYNTSTNQWAWISGDNSSSFGSNVNAVYGIIGVANATNKPGGRETGSNWVDNNGNLWLFGGQSSNQYMNDLWKYNPSTNQWTWMSGDNSFNVSGSYGVQGVAAAANKPGARGRTCASWKDNDGNLWLFGGNAGSSYFNDLWKYSIVSNQWTWMGGGNTENNIGVYGTKGLPATANIPGARSRMACWTDFNGNFWIMGGQGYDATGNWGTLNDLWMYSPLTNKWIWVKGDQVINIPGIYGTKGVPNVVNKPGARYGAAAWKDGVGDFWIYGGFGFGENGEDRLTDLWKISSAMLSPLPVHLLEFKGRLVNDNGVLNWKTENEESLSSYVVERSTDRKNYVEAGTVMANNISGNHQYNFTDPNIASLGASVIYYRLKQKDIDGRSTYSNIIALTIDKSLLVMMYPNPVVKTANVTITIYRAETVNVKVISGAGVVVKELQWKLSSGSTFNSIDLSVLAKGAYYLDISGETISKKIGFVKQ